MTTGKVDTKESDNYLTERQQQVKRRLINMRGGCKGVIAPFVCDDPDDPFVLVRLAPPPRPLMGKVSVDGSYQRCKSKEPQHEVVPVWRFERDNEAAGGRTFKLKRPFEETCPHLEHECSLGPGDAKRRRACENWHPQLMWANGGRLPLVPFGDFRQSRTDLQTFNLAPGIDHLIRSDLKENEQRLKCTSTGTLI